MLLAIFTFGYIMRIQNLIGKLRFKIRQLRCWWWKVRFTLCICGRARLSWTLGMDIAGSWIGPYTSPIKNDWSMYTPSEAVQEELSCWRD